MRHTHWLFPPSLAIPSVWPSSTNDDKFFMGVMRNIALRCSKVHGLAHGDFERESWHCHNPIQSHSMCAVCAVPAARGLFINLTASTGAAPPALSRRVPVDLPCLGTLMIEMNSMSCLVLGKSQHSPVSNVRRGTAYSVQRTASNASLSASSLIDGYHSLDPL